MQHPPYVRVTGQLFYDDAHVGDAPLGKKKMHAATLWELHPVLLLRKNLRPVPALKEGFSPTGFINSLGMNDKVKFLSKQGATHHIQP